MHRILPAAALATALAAVSRADVVTLVAVRDNTLYEHPSEELSNGAGEHMFVGRTDQPPGEDRRRALVKFDVASVVPPGAKINGVVLQVRSSKTKVETTPVGLHEVTQEWGEAGSDAPGGEGTGAPAEDGDATWNFAIYPTVTWFHPGGDFESTPSATTAVGGTGFYTFNGAGLAEDVQGWTDDPTSNHGWILIGDETVEKSAKRFDTREISDSSRWPRLTIDFKPPGPVGACCLTDGTCLLVGSADCSALGGTYHGNGSACFPDPCNVPTGACCLPDGTCLDVSAANCSAIGGTYHGDDVDCAPGLCAVLLEPYVDPLPLPQPATPVSGDIGGVAAYDIDITEFQQQLHRDLPPTTVWGFGGSYPGPTIEAGADLPVTVRWINDLRDGNGVLRTEHLLPVDTCLHGPDHHGNAPRTVTHLHGGHVPQESDGYPEWTILPGEETTYVYPNDQPPATLWYHDHALGITRLNVILGLAGFYLLRDDFEKGLGLPEGQYEVPLALQDRTFRPDGSFEYPAVWEDAFFGDKVLVNGKVWPYLNVARGKYRFRLLNGSNSRTYALTLSNGKPFVQIGTDGGLLPAPVSVHEIVISPGERADVVVDFAGEAAGTEILLVNSAPAPYPGNPGEGVIPETMKFIVQPTTGFLGAVPPVLRPLEQLVEGAAVTERSFLLRKLQGDPCTGFLWTINDLLWDDITERPVLDTIEVWSFVNPTSMVHPMHMHLVLFQVLDRQEFQLVGDDIVLVGDPIPPDENERGWKDTVKAMPNQVTRVIARFEDYAGFYSYHCHVLEHEDHEMMRQFEALESPGTPFCYGEACPCGNDNPQAGCENSTGKGGVIYSTGTASVSADDLVLTMVNLPSKAFGIPFMGPNQTAPTAFGDGLRCIGGTLRRYPVVQATSEGVSTLGPGIVALSHALFPPAGHIEAGVTWSFMLWYRDPNGPCGKTYSGTNAIAVTFVP